MVPCFGKPVVPCFGKPVIRKPIIWSWGGGGGTSAEVPMTDTGGHVHARKSCQRMSSVRSDPRFHPLVTMKLLISESIMFTKSAALRRQALSHESVRLNRFALQTRCGLPLWKIWSSHGSVTYHRWLITFQNLELNLMFAAGESRAEESQITNPTVHRHHHSSTLKCCFWHRHHVK